MVLCTNIYRIDEPAVYEYTVRAVTKGTFLVPRIRAEAMYDPEVIAEVGADRHITIQ
jgi:uncharacterized protein YfaS (alpha-2-macroglobulin family)